MLGKVILNYKINSLLGEGGMASVYLGTHQTLETKVAIKILKAEYVQNSNIRKRFLAEARNLAKMSHSNIVKVTDLIDEGDLVAIIMEYIEGYTLEEYIKIKGPLEDFVIQMLYNQMSNALNYVHSMGLIHRDIKPSNFIVSKEGLLKLLDFGIAKNTNLHDVDYTRTGVNQQMGTPLYMSPEQVKSTSEVTKKTDYYSIGVVLWQMVMNRKPYDSSIMSLPEIQVSILNEPLKPTNTHWDAVIKAATLKEPEKRSLIKPIKKSEDTIVDDVKTNDSMSSIQNQQQIPAKKNSIIWLVCIVLLVIGIILFFRNSSQSSEDSSSIETNEIETTDDSQNDEPLSINVNACSVMSPSYGYSYSAYNTIDKDLSTWWSPMKSLGSDVWINFTFNQTKTMKGISIHGGSHFPDFQDLGDLYWLNLRIRRARVVFSNGSEEIITLQDLDYQQKIYFNNPVKCNSFTLELLDYYPSEKWKDYCISELEPIF